MHATLGILFFLQTRVRISESGCWEWVKAIDDVGYGVLSFQGKRQRAHRFSFEKLVQPIRKGMLVLHHCDNRKCINPEHLYQGTYVDNRADMLNRKRWKHPWGMRSTCSKGHSYDVTGYRIDKSDGSRICVQCKNDSYVRTANKRKD